jgi:hypothetical protein
MIADLKDLKTFDVIKCPYQYQGGLSEAKRFVFLCNEVLGGVEHAICLKATSKVTLYQNNASLMAGVVYYPRAVIDFFELDTAVQPDNLHPIPHSQLIAHLRNGVLEHLGSMPADFKLKLEAAIQASKTMKPERKRSVLARL